MASLIRLGAIRAIKSDLVRSTAKLSLTTPIIRCINTSSKPPQASANTASTRSSDPLINEIIQSETADKSENWVSYGWNEDDKWWDRFSMHLTLFMSVTVCLVLGGTIMAYVPEGKYMEWSQREAYLQLRYKEANGLPPIDRNIVDPATMRLPTDEELGDTEIII